MIRRGRPVRVRRTQRCARDIPLGADICAAVTGPDPPPEAAREPRARPTGCPRSGALHSLRAMTGKDYERLIAAGVLYGPIELLNGVVTSSGRPYIFSPEQQRAARELGITVQGVVDAILDDPDSLAELRQRLAERGCEKVGE